MRVVVVALILLMPVSALAQQNVYGPGINSDATGRPYTWEPGSGPADRLSPVRPDAYGPGIGMDAYGRPVQPTPYPDSDE
jgi:hypothetical protein